jgi:hypothetical protein
MNLPSIILGPLRYDASRKVTIFFLAAITIYSGKNSCIRAEEYPPLFLDLEFARHSFLSPEARGRGYAGVGDRGDLDLTILNPASFSVPADLDLFVSAGDGNAFLDLVEFESLNGTSAMSAGQRMVPFSVGIGSSIFKQLNLGLLYSRQDELFYDLGETVMTDERGNVLGVYNDYDFYRGDALTIPICIMVFNHITLGVEPRVIFHKITMNFAYYRGEEEFKTFNLRFGSVIDLNRDLSIGLTLLPQIRKEFTLQLVSKNPEVISYDQPYDHTFPLEVQLGLKYKGIENRLAIFGDLDYQRSSVDPTLGDRWDIRLGAEYDINSIVRLRTGFLTTGDIREYENMLSDVKYSVAYFTLGGRLSFQHLSLDASMITSRLIPISDYKNTSFNIGFNVPFSIATK